VENNKEKTLANIENFNPPAFYTLSFVEPNLSHNTQSIVIMGVRIKRKKGLRSMQNGVKIETNELVLKLS